MRASTQAAPGRNDMAQPNPYAPPLAPVDQAPPPSLSKARKPISAWLVQLFAVAACVLLTVGLFRFASWLLPNRGLGGAGARVLLEFAWRVVALAAAIGALVGIQRRSGYGRLLGLAWIALMFAGWFYRGFVFKDPSAAPYADPARTAEKAGEFIAAVLVLALHVWWFRAFGFSEKARTYFRRAPSTDKASSAP